MTPQFLANVIISSSIVFMMASGFSLIYRVTRTFHFAHAIVFTSGAYFTFLLYRLIGLPLVISAVVALSLAAALGALCEVVVYRTMRRRGTSLLTLLLASLGLYVALQNAVSLCFGDDVKTIRGAAVREGLDIIGARVTSTQMAVVLVAVITLVSLTAFLRCSDIGKAMRAVASNLTLARTSGIETEALYIWVFVIGSALAGTVGILVAHDTDITPSMGMSVFMLSIVAVTVGGIRSPLGIALAALVLAMAQHLCAWKIGAQWKDGIAFVVLLAFLIVRPEGFLGKKLRKATV